MVDHFPADARYSAVSLGYNLSQALFGGTAPVICTALYHARDRALDALLWLLVVALISLVTTLVTARMLARGKASAGFEDGDVSESLSSEEEEGGGSGYPRTTVV